MAKIVLFEDDSDLLWQFSDALVSDGHTVIAVSNEREAREVLTNETIDLVILDVTMPECDGARLLRHALSRKRQIPVILHSDHNRFQINTLAWSAERILGKSSDTRVLRRTVDEVLSNWQRAEESVRMRAVKN